MIEKKKKIEIELTQKINQLQEIESMRNTTTTEIIQLKGKLDLITELINELKDSKDGEKAPKKED